MEVLDLRGEVFVAHLNFLDLEVTFDHTRLNLVAKLDDLRSDMQEAVVDQGVAVHKVHSVSVQRGEKTLEIALPAHHRVLTAGEDGGVSTDSVVLLLKEQTTSHKVAAIFHPIDVLIQSQDRTEKVTAETKGEFVLSLRSCQFHAVQPSFGKLGHERALRFRPVV